MADNTLEKLRPDRDLQCYFERPSAVAALSEASETSFTVSGSWRQQFDWAVVEWNRDNVFEHPSFRNLPDGDLSGLRLSYEETRTNCIPLDSDLYPTVDWPCLRVWTESGGFYKVLLKNYATPVAGGYTAAWAEFELRGTATPGDYAGLAWMEEHHTCRVEAWDTIESVAQQIALSVTNSSSTMAATAAGTRIRLTSKSLGANGNRMGVYSYVTGAKTETWLPEWQTLSGGISPSKWRVELDFAALRESPGGPAIPMNEARKMRWTYAAALQNGAYARSEFEARVSNWTVSGTNRSYRVAGRSSRRIEDDAAEVVYSGTWNRALGNYSGGSIHFTSAYGADLVCSYRTGTAHTLYLGTRRADNGGTIRIVVDGGAAMTTNLRIAGEDVLARVRVGEYGAGNHTVRVTHEGGAGTVFYFDFLEAAAPAATLPAVESDTVLALATDWDTDHSIALPAERTAWLVQALGFRGRVNHYAGAMWFYELIRAGHQYATGSVTFIGTPVFSAITQVIVNGVTIQHRNLIGDTAESIAKAFELEINRGYTAIRAAAQGNVLTIWARAMGAEGNAITLAANPVQGAFIAQASGANLAGGVNGEWRTDLASQPRLNRAARDWHREFFRTLKGYGLEAVAALSLELQHGDPTPEAGIAQRYPNGDAVLLNTPALQTNFSPASVNYWKEAHRELAELMVSGGLAPYVQFGEVQWWYFPLAGSGMPFYDAYTKDRFRAAYGREMRVIPSNLSRPEDFPEEAAFLPGLIGEFTNQVMAHVRQSVPGCRFEVLYPTDVNESALNGAVNYPAAEWTPVKLDSLKTESFTYTYGKNLDLCAASMGASAGRGFPNGRRAHLVGIGDYQSPWVKETVLARADGVKYVVLFALDQFCLIGYAAPVERGARRVAWVG